MRIAKIIPGYCIVNILLHPNTAHQLENLVQNDAHAIGIVGPSGSGKCFTAEHLAKQITQNQRLYEGLQLLVIKPNEKQLIAVEDIRSMLHFVNLKSGISSAKRVIIIKDAQQMSNEAQNAMLKIVEESPKNTVFIITFDATANILQTILSRISIVKIRPLSSASIIDNFKNEFKEKDIKKAILLGGGLIGMINNLLRDGTESIQASIDSAKKVLSSNAYERMCLINDVSHNEQNMLSALDKITTAVLSSSNEKSNNTQLKRMISTKRLILTSKPSPTKTNTKLNLTNLFLNL